MQLTRKLINEITAGQYRDVCSSKYQPSCESARYNNFFKQEAILLLGLRRINSKLTSKAFNETALQGSLVFQKGMVHLGCQESLECQESLVFQGLLECRGLVVCQEDPVR
jgi:hypothetical protein